MGKRSEILEGLTATIPAVRRYARALCAGAGASLADEMVQNALQSVGARIRARELRPADVAEARREVYAAVTAIASRKLAAAPRPAPRHPPIVHGLAALGFDERAVLLLVSLEGFGYDATGRIVGAPRDTALARLIRARAAIGADGQRPAAAASDGRARRTASHLRLVK
jgi:RNA polymerase sigma-70 factor (ECF subfamily)